MPKILNRLMPTVPERFLLALMVALAFMVFLTVDQMHWWQSKPDYAFGWLVPAFVVYLVFDRWSELKRIFQVAGPSLLPRSLRILFSIAAGFSLGAGLLFFLLGAIYRAGAGVTQPGSLALALGF